MDSFVEKFIVELLSLGVEIAYGILPPRKKEKRKKNNNIGCGGRVDMGGRCDKLSYLELLRSEDVLFSWFVFKF